MHLRTDRQCSTGHACIASRLSSPCRTENGARQEGRRARKQFQRERSMTAGRKDAQHLLKARNSCFSQRLERVRRDWMADVTQQPAPGR
ncbi:hypothetical protein B0H17DRAFT_1040194 [Mycena rosella]|uniref:Uncharacterized protein n=1 Tax=Mycena rosella TaxID=1033263 RepID=A0AAD7GRX1_MYCRO|nr:hypothetical protein B0H17DRAFT_1040194 [Mycena rosella]